MLIIRFARQGRKKQAFFKIVVAEKARAVQKKYVAELGFYDPLADAGKGLCKVDTAAVKKHIAHGAQMSQATARLLVKNGINEAEKFIITRSTKPKKEVPAPEEKPVEVEEKTEETSAEAETQEETSTDEVANEEAATPTEETPAEEKPAE